MPHEHLPDDWLVAWGAGILPEAEALITAAHLTLCPTCRGAAAVAEGLAATQVAAAAPLDLAPGSVDALLDRLDAPEPEPPPAGDPSLPWPIARLTGPLANIRWKWLAPFVRGVDLPVPTEGLPLRLVRMTAGAYMPHTHRGREVGLVLRGGWTDRWGHHTRGDLVVVDDLEQVHEQRVDADEDCVALVLNEAVTVPAIPFGRWLARVNRI